MENNKKEYLIGICSWDGTTTVPISLTDNEYKLIQKISEISEANSKQPGLPNLQIIEKRPSEKCPDCKVELTQSFHDYQCPECSDRFDFD